MNFSVAMNLINYGFVLFFGVVSSLYLADIPFWKYKRFYLLTLFCFGLAQLAFYFFIGENALYKCYPFLIHIPLILLIRFVCHRSLYLSMISVLSAYLLCTPRKWVGTLVSSFAGYDSTVANLTEVLITLPLLFWVIHYISPYIIRLKYESKALLRLFFLLLALYYVLEYGITVYTDLLYTASPALMEAFDSFSVLIFFIFSMISLEFSRQKNKVEQTNMLLHTATIQAQKEIARLSHSEKQAAIYRHDLRHHMNFLRSCIAGNQTAAALAYIDEICEGIESSKVTRYCENEVLNLILSSYADKAAAAKIPLSISVTATDFLRFQIVDLCSLLSNALENALNACSLMSPNSNRNISLKVFEKSRHLCISITNTYVKEPVFEDKIPVSHTQNHGIGTQSMISVVEKYKGIYGFSAGNGEFRFQASM